MDLARVQARAGLASDVGQGVRVTGGPSVRYADASRDPFAIGPIAALPASSFDGQLHLGPFVEATLTAVDRAVNPRQGVRLTAGAALDAGLTSAASTYGTLNGEAVVYVPLGMAPQLTLALRGGAEHRVGDFPFFDASVLGGPGSLRGFRRERFAGRTAVSTGAELRAKLVDLSTYFLPVQVGALGFVDAGRVWADVPAGFGAATFPGGGLQTGVGGGLWFGLLDRAVLNVSAATAGEGTLVTVGLGFAY